MPGNLPTTYPDLLGSLPRVGLDGKHEKVRTDTSTSFQFRRLPVQPVDRSGFAHSGPVVYSETEGKVHQGPKQLYGQTVHVSDRPPHSDRETSLVRSPSHETHTEALEATLASSGDPRKKKVIPVPISLHPHLDWWLDEGNVLRGQPLHPLRHALQVFTDASNEGWGAHLGDSTARGVWSEPESCFHINFLELKAVFRASLQGPDCSDCNRQHDCSFLHQQGGRYETRLSLCPPMETSVLVPSQGNSPEGKAHPGSLERDSGQIVQTQSGVSAGVQSLVFELGPTTGRPVCHPFQSQASQVCVTGAGSDSLSSRRPESTMGESGCLRLSSSLSAQPSDLQGDGSELSQNDSNCSRVAQHVLVLGPGQSISSGPLSASTSEGSGDRVFLRLLSQEPQQSESACLAPRASAIQEQGFTNEMAARIEAPQRL